MAMPNSIFDPQRRLGLWYADGLRVLLRIVVVFLVGGTCWGQPLGAVDEAAVLERISGNKPNLIFLMTDDQGIDAIEGANWPNDFEVHTPVLARLASQGRVFGQARVNPLCSPTRACLMTGRSALQTGVVTALSDVIKLPEFTALQNHELTLAEVLGEAGYETLFIDKWHLAAAPEQEPTEQGFAVAELGVNYYELDDPIAVGDEHVVRMTDFAIDRVRNRTRPDDPYLLTYWSVDPHSREDESGREPLGWWKVDESLLPSGEDYYHDDPAEDTDRDRFRAVVEAVDTEIGRLLYELNVIDEDGVYRVESNTVVFFMSDNGTAGRLLDRPFSGKGSLLEGGIRVPFFVFGANVPADGLVLDRLIHASDVFSTVAELVGVTNRIKGVPSLQSYSFADDMGWGNGVSATRELVVSSRGPYPEHGPTIAITDGRFKLICGGGAAGLDPKSTNSFYDLHNDPQELDDLLLKGLTREQRLAYHWLRNLTVEYWNASVSEPTVLTVDIPLTEVLSINNADEQLDPPTVGHVDPATSEGVEARIFMRFDIASIPARLPAGKTIDDVAIAQMVLLHHSDSQSADSTDTGRIGIVPATRDWMSGARDWQDLTGAYRPIILGVFDPPPFVVPRRVYSRGTPISFGQRLDLLKAVKIWLGNDDLNFGVILIAEPVVELGGDQQMSFEGTGAFLRLTLHP